VLKQNCALCIKERAAIDNFLSNLRMKSVVPVEKDPDSMGM